MPPQPLKVSVLYATGTPDPAIPKLFSQMHNIKLLRETRDPEALMAQYLEESPDVVLLNMDGLEDIPEWLAPLLSRLPRREVLICSHSRAPGLLIQLMGMRPGGFMPLPLNPKELQDHFQRVKAERQSSAPQSLGQTLAVLSAKGGSGATTVATNLALALAEILPGAILLMDLARPFPHVGQFLDLPSARTIKDLAASSGSLDSSFLKKVIQKHGNLDVIKGYPNCFPDSAGFPNFQSLEKILQTLRGSYRWICLDLGARLDLLYFQLLQKVDQILLITHLSVPDLKNLKTIKSLLRKLDIDDSKVKLLVNHYQKDYSLLGLKDVENICRQPVFYTLPHDYLPLIESINKAMGLGESAPRCKLWRRLKGLAKLLVDEQTGKTGKPAAAKPGAVHNGLLHRLFM